MQAYLAVKESGGPGRFGSEMDVIISAGLRSAKAASHLRLLTFSAQGHEFVGEWLSLVEHLVRDQGVGGSNPLSPTNLFKHINCASGFPSTVL
jgi:hypothetical protein